MINTKALVMLALAMNRVSAEFCSDLKCAFFRAGDGVCDPECLSPGCEYDAGDCCDADICSIEIRGDGVCNPECNSVSCGFDFGDCPIRDDEVVSPNSNLIILVVCASVFASIVFFITALKFCRKCYKQEALIETGIETERKAGDLTV